MTSPDTLDVLTRFIDNKDPSVEECIEAFTPLTVGEYDDVHIAALLTTIKTRGETANDLLGAARAFLKAGRPFPITGAGIMDTAGTGGDGKNTINITTAASLIAAAGGVKMIKCGNRSVSSKSGSADVLESMNIPLDLDPERAVRQFEASNFTFLFAPAYNPAIGHVQPVRRALKFPTIFNTLGPILAPARPEFQIMGIANPKQGPAIAEVFKELGRTRALVVHGDGSDEVSVTGTTQVWELNDGEITHYELEPADLGVTGSYTFDDLAGGNGEENAKAIYAVLNGGGEPAHRDAIAASAGAMFYLYGMVDSFAAGTEKARGMLDDGSAAAWLQKHEETDYAD
ncbi:anthranilate phosphoribosyltransferase [Corynebacterium guangdongense]|uniref:Anthranilate phosphoribosyltransferase n=1 Tax=Corynebacterium guangdongense TaxID=1783348 RepID=A0ABU2A253_9CORY|nr:anthranilate phosphoribosyltransferase [Corynebacterium guangdongense]MDR7330567.1 anthranilate phosphoribosyltransferase [Corynebacterium guangdongense]WJZ19121.1 Bifunctional protein TrpGD [Corynebacterium guangdongense]